jgi:hypothetical protein
MKTNRMRKINLFFIFIVLQSPLSFGQKAVDVKLNGSWELLKKELGSGLSEREVLLDKEGVKDEFTIEFGENSCDVVQNGIVAKGVKYEVVMKEKSLILNLGNRSYLIEKHGGKELVLLEQTVFPARLFFRKKE